MRGLRDAPACGDAVAASAALGLRCWPEGLTLPEVERLADRAFCDFAEAAERFRLPWTCPELPREFVSPVAANRLTLPSVLPTARAAAVRTLS